MKLTEQRLKEIIIEELNNLNENPDAQAKDDSTDKEQATTSINQLKKDLIDTSRNISNVKGLDPKEIALISAVIGSVIQASSAGSAGTILQRVHDVIQKTIK